jgi:hypothetical protein
MCTPTQGWGTHIRALGRRKSRSGWVGLADKNRVIAGIGHLCGFSVHNGHYAPSKALALRARLGLKTPLYLDHKVFEVDLSQQTEFKGVRLEDRCALERRIVDRLCGVHHNLEGICSFGQADVHFWSDPLPLTAITTDLGVVDGSRTARARSLSSMSATSLSSPTSSSGRSSTHRASSTRP